MNSGNDTIPHDAATEAGALACVLQAGDDANALLKLLHLELFHDIRHKTVLLVLCELDQDGKPLDMVNLTMRLRATGRYEDVGGEVYVAELPDKTPSSANFPVYLDELNALATRRAVLRDATEAARLAQDRTVSRGQLLDAVRKFSEAYRQDATDDVELLLESRAFRPDNAPPQLRAIYQLTGQTICTPGNLTTITAPVKAGKTAVLGAMVASAMAGNKPNHDLLGFKSSNPGDLGVLLFDSEQSLDDFWHCIARAVKRAGLSKPPPWLRAYCLTGLSYKRGWEAVNSAIRRAAEEFGGIHSVLLDGIADFMADVNDPGESNGLVSDLHAIAIERDCSVIGVIHFNPGSEKSRGHLGSQLERKAETNLALEKDADETTVIYSTKNRRAGIPKERGPRFKFSLEAGMHVSIESRASTKDAVERERFHDMALGMFADHPSMRRTDLEATVKNTLTVSPKTAERRVARMIKLGVIKKSAAGLYVIGHQ